MVENESNEAPKPTDCAAHLIGLIMNQDHVCQGWLKFLVTIQTGLIVAFGFTVRTTGEKPGSFEQWSAMLLSIIIPIFGILAAILVAVIVVRERKWQSWYVERFNDLSGQLPRVFPKKNEDDVSKQRWGYISWAIVLFAVFMVLGWFVVGGLMVRKNATAAPNQGYHLTLTGSIDASYTPQ